MEERITTSGVAENRGLFLVAKRLPGGPLSEKWEFVGGKNRWGESVEDTLQREWLEELNLRVDVKEHLLDTEFIYNDTHFTLKCHRVEVLDGEVTTLPPKGRELPESYSQELFLLSRRWAS